MSPDQSKPEDLGASPPASPWPLLALLLASLALFAEALLGWGHLDASTALVGQEALWPGQASPPPFDWSPARIHQLWDAWSFRQWQAGSWPLWQPDEGLGHPLWANGQAAPANPFKLLAWGAAAGPGVAAFLVARWAFGAAGAWLLARSWGLPSAPAALVAVAFAFQGAFLWHFWYPELHAWVMLPWLAWLAWRLLEAPSAPRLAWAALGLGFTAQLGHAEGALFAAAGGGALALGAWLPGAGLGAARHRWPWLAAALLLGVGASAWVLWPFLDLASQAQSYLQDRAGSELAGVDAAWGAPQVLASLGRHLLAPSAWPAPWSFNAWATTPALAFALWGLGRSPQALRGAAWAAGGLGLGCLLLLPPVAWMPWPVPVPNAFYATPLLALALALAGGAGLARWQALPQRAWGLAGVALALAGAAGVLAWGLARLVAAGGPPPPGGHGVALAVALVVALLALRPARWALPAAWLVVALAWGEGAWAMRQLHPPRAGGYASQHPAAKALQALGPLRIAGAPGTLSPNLPQALGLRSFGLMEAWMPPRLLGYWRAMRSQGPKVGTVLELQPGFDRDLARLAGLGAVLCPLGSEMDRGLRARPGGFALGGEAEGLAWHLARPAPEAWVSHHPRRVADAAAAEAALAAQPALGWVAPVVEAPAEALTGARAEGPASSPAWPLRQRPNEAAWRVELPQAGLLVVQGQWDRDWVASLDGQGQPVWPTQLALQGVWVPAGRHELVLSYRPRAFARGLALSQLSWAIAGLLLLWPQVARRWRRKGKAG